MVRSAFTLIELIFAIVVIGISVISLPMMSQATAKGIDANLVQEAIFAAASELNEAVTVHWDEASLEPNSPSSLARVIDDGTCINDNNLSTYRQKIGHINQPLHRRCLDSSSISIAYSNSNNLVDALEDMQKSNQALFTTNTPSVTGYKNSYNVNLSVTPNANFESVNNINMKKITLNINDSNGKLITSLVTYSANIGEVDYFKKVY